MVLGIFSKIYFCIWYCVFLDFIHTHSSIQFIVAFWGHMMNDINPGSQIPQVEAKKRCSRDPFASSGMATALIDRHFWYTFLQQSMKSLTNTAILLTYTSRFHWRFSGNWQEHICEPNIRCFGSPSHRSLGSDRLNVTVCRTCTVPLWDVQRTVGSWSYWKNILGWLALRSSSHTSLFYCRIWYNLLRRGGPKERMTVENIGKWQSLLTAFRWWPPYSTAPAPKAVWLQ